MWMWTPPSSTIRRASAAYSAGVYGIAGHWSRLASAPEIAQVMTTGSSTDTARASSYRHDPALLPWPLDLLAGRHLEPAADRGPRLARVDHVVDHVVAGGDVDVDDLAEVLDQLLLLGRRILGLLDLAAEDDLDRALGSHHADLGARPRDDQVRLIRAPAHHVVAGAVGLARDHGDLRHGGVGGRVQHLRPVADDPGLLDLRADHEPRHVHQEHERDPIGVHQVDEPRRLVGRVVVEDPSELLGLVGDDSGRTAPEPRQAGDDRPGPLRLEIEVLAVVD